MTDLSIFKNKTVLVTGGSGSFGHAFSRKLLESDVCHKVIIFSSDEWEQWQMQNSEPIYKSSKARYFLGNVRDISRLNRAFNEVQILVHAAALKQVPAAEYNPSEFVNTNICGALNVIDAAINARVEHVIALSTDKAVNPVNLYGATKLCSDKLFVAANAYVGAKGYPKFSVVRYGNVAGTRGSIVPLWQEMLAKGVKSLPITDARMTRFWITLDQAVDFVCSCFARMHGGEIFVPKIPSIRITDLAEAIAPGFPHHYFGIREGEKLHEWMINVEDGRFSVEQEDRYVILPHDKLRSKQLEAQLVGKRPTKDFAYTSDTNNHWLTIEELRVINQQLTKA